MFVTLSFFMYVRKKKFLIKSNIQPLNGALAIMYINIHANKDNYYRTERENVTGRADQPAAEGVSEPQLCVQYKYFWSRLQSVVSAQPGRSNTWWQHRRKSVSLALVTGEWRIVGVKVTLGNLKIPFQFGVTVMLLKGCVACECCAIVTLYLWYFCALDILSHTVKLILFLNAA